MNKSEAIALLSTIGVEIKDNRRLGMSFSILKQPDFKYINLIFGKDEKLYISTCGIWLNDNESEIMKSELSRAIHIVKTFNNAK